MCKQSEVWHGCLGALGRVKAMSERKSSLMAASRCLQLVRFWPYSSIHFDIFSPFFFVFVFWKVLKVEFAERQISMWNELSWHEDRCLCCSARWLVLAVHQESQLVGWSRHIFQPKRWGYKYGKKQYTLNCKLVAGTQFYKPNSFTRHGHCCASFPCPPLHSSLLASSLASPQYA